MSEPRWLSGICAPQLWGAPSRLFGAQAQTDFNKVVSIHMAAQM